MAYRSSELNCSPLPFRVRLFFTQYTTCDRGILKLGTWSVHGKTRKRTACKDKYFEKKDAESKFPRL